ncbi:amino acid-binding protein [Halobaculum gomorrense]|uniref:ACT domain-containing protein n=1 Tax=Halobaculum gomorrense TaxID=43928 RepID=A0A1M5JY61_9EURY|nr:amino acid-binding protein [Halobaculum gomorrense]SHG45512.1 ACT domain-containing protein [Halobaculum gomorrense]
MPSEPTTAPDERPVDTVEADDGDDAAAETDGGHETELQAHTIRLELVDEPGQLLAALKPIADNGANLLSIFHERGSLTPRGRIPVEVDIECPPDRFEGILDDLRSRGVNVIQADAEEYGDEVTVVLVGHLVDTDLSDTLKNIQDCSGASVADIDLSAPAGAGSEAHSSARLRLRARAGETASVVETIRAVAAEKDIDVIAPLEGRR